MANPNIVNVGTINGKTIGAKLSTTSATALVTGASNKVTKVNCVYVSNTDGANAQEITLEFTDTSASLTYKIASTISVPADATLIVISKNESIYLEETDILKATAGTANKLEVVVSYEEIS